MWEQRTSARSQQRRQALGLIKKVGGKKNFLKNFRSFFFRHKEGPSTEGRGRATRREELAKRHPRKSPASLRKKKQEARKKCSCGRRGRGAFEGCLRSRRNGDRPRSRYSLKAKSQWVRLGLAIKGNPHLSATRGAIIAARLKPPVHAVLVEHMPTRKEPQILLCIIILQTDEALNDNDKKDHLQHPITTSKKT